MEQQSFFKNNHILQISARPFLYEQGKPTLDELDLEYITACQPNAVWMMGVWKLTNGGLEFDYQKLANGDFKQMLENCERDDVIGSCFAVDTPYQVSPALGGEKALAKIRSTLKKEDILLFLDFVPNHTARDASWTGEYPEYYVLDDDQKIVYGSDGWGQWRDTAQLNYWNPELRKEMTNQMMNIAEKCDGVRCDMAHLILNHRINSQWGKYLHTYPQPKAEFWKTCIAKVKAEYPNFVFIAECYSDHSYLLSLGFDFVYNKTFYDLLVEGHLDSIRTYISSQSTKYLSHCCFFTSNHDEPRAVKVFKGYERACCALAIVNTLPGAHLHWMGEHFGFTNQIAVQLRRQTPEIVHTPTKTFYKTLITIVTDPVFTDGNWEYLPVGNSDSCWRLLAWRWQYNDEKRLCVMNYSDFEAQGTILLSNADPDDDQPDLTLTELFTKKEYRRNVSEMRTRGLHVVVDSWGVQIFKY